MSTRMVRKYVTEALLVIRDRLETLHLKNRARRSFREDAHD